jgi:glutamine---fructose-6-phosphate transaminase (isomerizing)
VCEIVGYIGPKKVVPLILNGLKRLEYRGYDSAGIAVLNQRGAIEIRRAPGKLHNLEESLRQSPIEGSYGIGHTRWATHGRPTEKNAHPHCDCTGQIVVVHNGIIENYVRLKHQLAMEGHKFETETDTEVIAHLIEKNLNGGALEDAVRKSIKQLTGVYSFAILSSRDPHKIVAARFGPPSVIGLGQNECFIASDVPAILKHTRDIFFLADGDVAILFSCGGPSDGHRWARDSAARTARHVDPRHDGEMRLQAFHAKGDL